MPKLIQRFQMGLLLGLTTLLSACGGMPDMSSRQTALPVQRCAGPAPTIMVVEGQSEAGAAFGAVFGAAGIVEVSQQLQRSGCAQIAQGASADYTLSIDTAVGGSLDIVGNVYRDGIKSMLVAPLVFLGPAAFAVASNMQERPSVTYSLTLMDRSGGVVASATGSGEDAARAARDGVSKLLPQMRQAQAQGQGQRIAAVR